MRTENLSIMPIIPEEYDAAHADKVDWSRLNSEMSDQERKFVNGLIRYYQPQSLLEVGVSQGGGSVNLLNSIIDQPEAGLTSIDRMEVYYGDGVTPVGNDVPKTYPDLPEGKWNLIKGKDPSEVMETLGQGYDFAVIDTAHLHPIESLNFLCVLPYLKDGAIVVLHDISVFYYAGDNGNNNGRSLATRILMTTLTGEKIFPQRKTTAYVSNDELVHNIVAVQINADTRKQIGDLFQALYIPWETYPGEDIRSIKNLLSKHYPIPLMEEFRQAARLNAAWVLSGRCTFSLKKLTSAVQALQNKKVMFYGAGQNMHSILDLCEAGDVKFEFPIWDVNARRIGEIYGHPVVEPNFEERVPEGSTAIITIGSKMISSGVRKILEHCGWTVINGMDELFDYRSLSSRAEDFDKTQYPVEFTKEEKELIQYVKKNHYSMVSDERLFATVKSCKYIIESGIEGDFVECGVWRGGNAILAAGIFRLYHSNKRVWLFDTFEGFSGIDFVQEDQLEQADMDLVQKDLYDVDKCGNSLEDVKRNFEERGLLNDNVVFVKGDIMETLEAGGVPENIAILRLDTDFYESTKKELEILYPQLSIGGVLMIDDYGHLAGARLAVEEYFGNRTKPLLQYIDYTGRLGIKTI